MEEHAAIGFGTAGSAVRVGARRPSRGVSDWIDAALAWLAESWRVDGPVVEQLTDLGWVYLLAGNSSRAVDAVGLGLRGRARQTRAARELLGACVVVDGSVWLRAFRVAVSSGTLVDRVRSALAVTLGRFARPRATSESIAQRERTLQAVLGR